MKHSIKKQMAMLIVACISAVALVSWGISYFFLEDYYIAKKSEVLINGYKILNRMTPVGDSNIENNIELRKFLGNNNLKFGMTYWTNGKEVTAYTDVLSRTTLEKKMQDYIFKDIIEEQQIYGKTYKATDKYRIRRVNSPISDIEGSGFQEEVEMTGQLEDGSYFVFTTPIESLRVTANLTSSFLGIVFSIGIIISVIIVWYISKKATEPIMELVDISERMTQLDFNAKYKSGGKNEISLLGRHFNQMSETLEEKISELKSANLELQKDLEEKVQVDEMRKEFLSNVSHELKTPIALIQGYAEGLNEGINDDDESREFYCNVIMDEANKMNIMVKKLLTLNQIEFGKEQIALERFDIITLIRGVLQHSDILLKQKEAKVVFNHIDPIYVWADEFKIEEVVSNYISNAINHLDYEKIIEVRVLETEKTARISVFNTGNPIPKEDLDNVWVKFYKVDKARTREYGGSGIGLSIVKAIMDSFHKEYGVINYQNGVEFWFELDKDQVNNENKNVEEEL
ncbi:MAG TPA: HAMP domain-containing protein [Candidatus Merdenecus merdavium]|nr:HAMP domain-containing protein [Candidatus Merdenecus merdavium]